MCSLSARKFGIISLFFVFLLSSALPAGAQQAAPEDGYTLYQQLRKFELSGGSAVVTHLVLKRDRVEITFNSGKFYFEPPIGGRVRGAVFIGGGTFRAEPPPSVFERENVRRMLKADVVESDFGTAVLRFTDDTFDVIGKGATPGGPPEGEAVKLALKFEPRLLKETGVNVSARLALSIVNQESPGFFFVEFDGGKRERFSLLLDYQSRIPVTAFDINGGEKGLIFAYRRELYGNDIWMAFYGQEDYQRGRVEYSDKFDLITIPHQKMDVDLREPKKYLKLKTEMEMVSRVDGLRAIPLALNDGLSEYENYRLKRALRVKSARLADGGPLQVAQEDWDSGLTIFLPSPRKAGEKFSIVLEAEGDFIYNAMATPDCHYPLSTTTWFPRHGYLNRSTFDITFLHRKSHRVASVGLRVREEKAEDSTSDMVTQWKMEKPVALVTFALGPFERHAENRKLEQGEVPVEFYSLPGALMAIKEDFILAEMGNALNFFHVLFGAYPYQRFGAVIFPFGFGQGFPTLLLLPKSDRASKYTYIFVSHEAAHQWWGNIVSWRSYRDQWLSEGFAEYSGLLYTARRDKPSGARELLEYMRRSLKDPPETLVGIGKGRLTDVGPIILGHRLSTRETLGAYQTLIYNKGALVLRMLHFLFTDPGTGEDKWFYDMMGDFVRRHRDSFATTEDFWQVANEHFGKTPTAQKYGLKDLNWFFNQWVYQTALPTYRLSYTIQPQNDGSVVVAGTVYQDNAPEEWFMPLPLVLTFGKDQMARGTVHAHGPKTPFSIKVPTAPQKVELDPALWILSEKTTTQGAK